jgi:NADPH-dependent 2,4-dienoyl-CoA reductase/sulfur reductase-like enzyme
MTDRLVVVGGDAAGMSAASTAKRRAGDALDIVALERGGHASYSACGIPYWVAGDVGDADDLVARTPAQHAENGIDLRLGHEVTAIDLDRGEVEVADGGSGSAYRIGFDRLMIATGAVPIRPDLPGVDAQGIFGVQTLDDGGLVIATLASRKPRRAVVVGGGYIGVEMAEAMVRRGLEVVVVDQAAEPMTTLDPDMGRLVHASMEQMGIDVRSSTPVEGFEAGPDGWVRSVVAGGAEIATDVVVLGIGVQPNVELADAGGLPVGDAGGLQVDLRMGVKGHPNIWAGGDCVETFNLVSQRWVHIPLGTHANKHGRVAGTNIAGGYATFPGVVGTAMTKVCDLEIARTGLRESDARAAGFEFESVTIESRTRAGYFPQSRPMTVKMLAERGTGRLLGAQIVGREGSAKRIDVCAVALWNRMTVADLMDVDLGYAPPFSPVWDPVLVAARAAVSALQG